MSKLKQIKATAVFDGITITKILTVQPHESSYEVFEKWVMKGCTFEELTK